MSTNIAWTGLVHILRCQFYLPKSRKLDYQWVRPGKIKDKAKCTDAICIGLFVN